MFHNLCEFIKDEMKEIDRKIGAGSRPSSQELEYADLLAHMKKSLLTVDAMENPEEYGYNDAYARSDYSRSYGARGRSGRRGYNRMYRDNDEMMSELQELMYKAPDEKTKRKIEQFMSEISEM